MIIIIIIKRKMIKKKRKKKKQKTCEMNMNILQSVTSHKQNLIGLQILFKQCHKY